MRARGASTPGCRSDQIQLTPVPTTAAGSLAQAYAACEALARSHYENFPVASMLLPKAMRPHIAAIYAFARRADDIADEGAATAAKSIKFTKFV